MDDSTQQRINKLTTIKTNLKNRIQNTLGKNLSNVKFEDYYRYITTSDSLNPAKTYSSMSNDIAGRLIRVNEIKQNIKEAIEDNFNANLSNVSFENYHNYIKSEYSLKSLKESTFYQGWKYRVQVLLNGKPAGEGITGTFSLYNNSGSTANTYEITTDENGVLSITINWGPGTHLFKTTCQGKTISETVVVNLASQEKIAGAVTQGASVSGRSRAWSNLTASRLGDEEPSNYATCPNLASKSGTYNTPYYVDLSNFGFTIPNNSKIYRIDHRHVARLNKNAPSNPQFGITAYVGQNNSLTATGQGTLLASQATNWQYFISENGATDIIGKLTPTIVNSSNFKTRIVYSTNQNGNTGAIDWTYYKITLHYSPPQNI